MSIDLQKLLSGELIESTNWHWAILCTLIWWRALHWKKGAAYNTTEFVTALQWMMSAMSLRALWFAISRMFGDSGDKGFPWNEVMFSARPFILIITLAMFTYGSWRLIQHLEGRSNKTLTTAMAIIIGVSFSLGFS